MISIFIGSISLLYVLLNYLIADNKNLKKILFYGSKSFWGSLAGFTSFVLHSGGLPLNIYFMSIYNKKVQFVAGVVFSIALINAKAAVLTSFKKGLNKIFFVIGVSIKPGQIEIVLIP